MELKEVEPGLTADEPRYKDLFLADADGSNLRYLGPFVTHPSWHPSESRFFLLQSQRNAFAPGLEPGRPKPVYQQRTSGSCAGLPDRYRMENLWREGKGHILGNRGLSSDAS